MPDIDLLDLERFQRLEHLPVAFTPSSRLEPVQV
jgi:hypothetical protein